MSIGSIWRAERWSVISFAAGAILFALGIALIIGSRYTDWHWVLTDDPEIDAIHFYTAWNEVELATGIIFVVIGMAVCTATVTYAILRKRTKDVR